MIPYPEHPQIHIEENDSTYSHGTHPRVAASILGSFGKPTVWLDEDGPVVHFEAVDDLYIHVGWKSWFSWLDASACYEDDIVIRGLNLRKSLQAIEKLLGVTLDEWIAQHGQPLTWAQQKEADEKERAAKE